jgi:hypothetical protein
MILRAKALDNIAHEAWVKFIDNGGGDVKPMIADTIRAVVKRCVEIAEARSSTCDCAKKIAAAIRREFLE